MTMPFVTRAQMGIQPSRPVARQDNMQAHAGVKRARPLEQPMHVQTRAGTRRRVLASDNHVLWDVLPHVLAFVTILDSNVLRHVSHACKTLVSEFPWSDTAPITHIVKWRAAFPRAVAAHVACRVKTARQLACLAHTRSLVLPHGWGEFSHFSARHLTLSCAIAALSPLPPSLELLQLHDLGTQGVASLAQALQPCRRLTVLQVHGPVWAHNADAQLAGVLEGQPGLTALYLNDTMRPLPKCMAALASLTSLTTLRLSGFAMWDTPTAAALEGALAHLPLLTHLKIGWECNGMHEPADALARSLRHLPHLTHLRTRGCFAPQSLFAELWRVPLLKTLSVTDCVTPEGETIVVLAAALPCLPALVKLDLSNTPLWPWDARLVVSALARTPELRVLRIHTHASIGLAQVLPLQLTTLDWWMVGELHMDEHVAAELAARLKHMIALRTLALTQPRVGATACGAAFARCLVGALEHLPRLVSLDLSGQRIGDDGVRRLMALPRLPPTLNLVDTAMSLGGCMAVAERLSSLSHLSVSLDFRVDGSLLALARGLRAAKPAPASLTLEDVNMSKKEGEALLASKGVTSIHIQLANARLRRALARTHAL